MHYLTVDVLIGQIHEGPWRTDNKESQLLNMLRQILYTSENLYPLPFPDDWLQLAPSKSHESKKISTSKSKSVSKVDPLSFPTSTAIPDAACPLQHTSISLQTLRVSIIAKCCWRIEVDWRWIVGCCWRSWMLAKSRHAKTERTLVPRRRQLHH